MTDSPTRTPELCTRFHRASELIGRRWTGAILFLLMGSRCRFTRLRSAIPEVTDRMLSDRLRELEAEGIVERTVVPDTPVRVEYSLTKKGRALAPAIAAISEWANRWGDAHSASPSAGRTATRRSSPRPPARPPRNRSL
jgi:DNA-binding HxlR family transcriptional regulator